MTSSESWSIPIVFMVSEHNCLLCEILCWLCPVACHWLGGTHFSWPNYQASHFSTNWGWGPFICYMHVIVWCPVVSWLGWCLHRRKASWSSEMFNQGLIRVGSFWTFFIIWNNRNINRGEADVLSKSNFKLLAIYTLWPLASTSSVSIASFWYHPVVTANRPIGHLSTLYMTVTGVFGYMS